MVNYQKKYLKYKKKYLEAKKMYGGSYFFENSQNEREACGEVLDKLNKCENRYENLKAESDDSTIGTMEFITEQQEKINKCEKEIQERKKEIQELESRLNSEEASLHRHHHHHRRHHLPLRIFGPSRQVGR